MSRGPGARTLADMTQLRRPLAGLAIVLLALALGACGGHGTSDDTAALSDAEPSSGDPGSPQGFAPGDLVDLVKPGNSTPTSPATVDQGAWSQSFEVVSLDPPEVIQFYEQQLSPEWDEQEDAAPLGGCEPSNVPAEDDGCSYQGTWAKGTERLEITASPDSGGDTELNLQLSQVP
jgi:hypothetical protein